MERIGAIARSLYAGNDPTFERLILLHKLGSWLEKVGNLSRASLATGISEAELRKTAASIARLAAPQSDAERAVAAAVIIDAAGPRGLAERFARARREGRSVTDVAKMAMSENGVPGWMSDDARRMLEERRRKRDEFCEAVIADAQVRNTPAR